MQARIETTVGLLLHVRSAVMPKLPIQISVCIVRRVVDAETDRGHEVRKTPRGFVIYGEVEDSRGCVVRVQQSSIVGQPHVWIFTDDPNGVYDGGKPSPHLTREQAKAVIAALRMFVDLCE